MDHHFGPFRYDAEQRLLFRGREPVQLVPKAIDTLHVLLERRGRVVEKSELMRLVWPDTTVEEIGLARNVSILRKALGDDAEGNRYIETVPKRGYRFVAEVTDAAVPVPPRQPGVLERKRWWIPAAGIILFAALIYWQFYSPSRYLPPARASIVIVPFEIVGAGVDPAISQSLNEAIVTDVSKNPGLHVVSPSTVRRYQRIGFPLNLMARLLGSQVILEGTLQSSGDRVRATARLADVHAGKVIWAEGYEVPSGDNGAELQTARAIASSVGNRLAAGAR